MTAERISRSARLLSGVGITVAVGILSAIDNVGRFKTPDQLASYFGLVPSVSQSAERCYRGSITKEGTSYGRWLAIEAAQALALSGAPIAASYHRIKHKKGHNIAVTALARKLIVLVWHMLTKNQPYRYAPPARLREKMRTLNPELPARDRSEVALTPTNKIYEEVGIPVPPESSNAEKRTATINRRTITRIKNGKNPSKQKYNRETGEILTR